MERRHRVALVYLALGVVFLVLAISRVYRTAMIPLAVAFLVLALVQWKQRPRPRGGPRG